MVRPALPGYHQFKRNEIYIVNGLFYQIIANYYLYYMDGLKKRNEKAHASRRGLKLNLVLSWLTDVLCLFLL